MNLRSFTSGLLAILLGLQIPVRAQAPQPGPPPSKLNLVIVEGEGAINNIKQRTAREPIVQVEDENRKPIAGASVVFLLPNNGASGLFSNGSRLLTVMTDQNGQAVMRGFTPNNTAGQMQVRVTASFRGQTATATITQTNVVAVAAGAGIATGKLIAILAVVGGAAAAGAAVAVTRGGNNSPAPTTTTPAATVINPGSPTVGPPR
ncbi:MAG TPA: hypothetical protein VM120_09960 [Bryobacteraceae bacterium]|nr:hypothetical protein [Bryobacteraceae bacterium]